ncbi:hypothetical protein MCOR25_007839 [Pyricularia grisea]|nr:hypothetical protein MCOR25_007839 [Pyricularia grisea]
MRSRNAKALCTATYQLAVRSITRNTARTKPGFSLVGSCSTPTVRKSIVLRRLYSSHSRTRTPRPEHAPVNQQLLTSSMSVRRFSLALVSGLVGYGAWYSYRDSSTDSTAATRAFTNSATNPTKAGVDGAATTRNVLVITADELYTSTFVGEGPISKVIDDERRMVVEMLNPEQSTQKLRKNEQSYIVNRGQGVVRYDLVQLPSNDPIEDDHAEKIVEVPNGSQPSSKNDWMFWGVFDGHSGWTTSAKLRQALIGSVARELNDTYRAAPGMTPTPEAIEAAMKTGFVRLDDEIVNQSVEKVLKQNNKTVAAELLAPALSGSCALLSFYDSSTGLLRVACTGDSRAVLGRRSASSGKWTATPLSTDQTGANPEEAARMRKQHPGEEHVVRNGRVLGGLEPTRAFGDASYKWTRDISERLRRSFFGRTPSALLRTPPYVTAEPVVTTTKIEPQNGDFLVLATDGLWEMLTNEEVVGLVGKWLETQQTGGSGSSYWSKMFGGSSTKSGLPVEAVGAKDSADGQKTPIRVQQWGLSPDGKDRFVVKDKNVATHLVRNALGGKNEEQVSALLTLPSPFSRRYRDDLTVQVIFFGNEGEKTGDVVVNEEATSMPGSSSQPAAAKAKL